MDSSNNTRSNSFTNIQSTFHLEHALLSCGCNAICLEYAIAKLESMKRLHPDHSEQLFSRLCPPLLFHTSQGSRLSTGDWLHNRRKCATEKAGE